MTNWCLVAAVMSLGLSYVSCNEVEQSSVVEYTTRVSLPFHVSASSNTSTQCQSDFARYVAAIKRQEVWALRMLDATGKIPSGLTIGNFYEMGTFSECAFGGIAARDSNNATYTPSFCMAYLNAATAGGSTVFWYGVCFPSSCSGPEIAQVVQQSINKLKGTPLDVIAKTFSVRNVICQQPTLQATAWGISALVFIIIILIVAFSATLYDMHLHYHDHLLDLYRTLNMSKKTYLLENSTASSHENIAIVNNGETPRYISYTEVDPPGTRSAEAQSNGSAENQANSVPPVETVQPPKKSNTQLLKRLLLCFSVFTNGEKVMNTDPPKTSGGDDQIGCAHGMRFISMTWVILGHTFYLGVQPYTSLLNIGTQIKQYQDSWQFTTITSGILSVDTFFVMSGLLTSYLTLKTIRRMGGPGKLNWLLFYVHRYLRLTPVYAVCLFIIMPLFRHLYYGPVWPQQDVLEPQCTEAWWANLLYINNLVYDVNLCMGHTWFLANDMQFYIISPLAMIPWFYNAFAGFAVSFALVFTSVISTAVIATSRNYTVDLINPPKPIADGYYTNSFHDIYTKPYSRVGTYAIGLMAGYIMYRISCDAARKERYMVMYRSRLFIASLVGWAVAAFLCLSAVFGTYDYQRGATEWSIGLNAFYMSCARVGWAIGISYVIMACAYGYGGWVNRFLSWRVFMPLSRLTYCAYLVHLYVIQFLYASIEEPLSLSVLFVVYYYVGHIALSYAVAFCFSMLFEAPILCLEKILFKR